MSWIWGIVIATIAAAVAGSVAARRGRRACLRERQELEASHRATIETHEASLARQRAALARVAEELEGARIELDRKSAEIDRLSARLADAIDGAVADAHLLEVEKKRANTFAGVLSQLVARIEADRAAVAEQLTCARAGQKAAEGQAGDLARALDEIRCTMGAARASLIETGAALEQMGPTPKPH